MTNEAYTGLCLDGTVRTITVDLVSLMPPGETYPGGLLLTGTDAVGATRRARTAWTHAVHVRADNDSGSVPRRGWKIMDGDTMLRFVEGGYAADLVGASGCARSPYPAALGACAPWVRIPFPEFEQMRDEARTLGGR